MAHKRMLVSGIALILLVLSVEGRPENNHRRKRLIGGLESRLDIPVVDEPNDNYIDEQKERDARLSPIRDSSYSLDRGPTYPPFPGDEDDYDTLLAQERTDKPRFPPTTTTTTYETVNEIERDDEEEPLHKKIVPWIQRQWGRTKGFFKKHYDNTVGR